MQYQCKFFDEPAGSIPWRDISSIRLREVVTGHSPRLNTTVKACWNNEALLIRFECEDDHSVATMSRRDDPLYQEDVVEVFLDLQGTGKTYYEFEVSPLNVVFDAIIYNDLQGNITCNTSWDAKGLQTMVKSEPKDMRQYELRIPFSDLEQFPFNGAEWRWNVFRIDQDPQGDRHYWAWLPTKAVQFHLPHYFGTLVFQR